MPRHYVESTALAWYDYDAQREELTVEFADNGDVYAYEHVPRWRIDEMLSASSLGSYFVRYIRNGPYSYRRLY
jgi:hypothetical protein